MNISLGRPAPMAITIIYPPNLSPINSLQEDETTIILKKWLPEFKQRSVFEQSKRWT